MGVVGEVEEAVTEIVLRPRPGLAICSIRGGRVEIVMRILAAVLGSLPALIAAVVIIINPNAVLPDTVNAPPENSSDSEASTVDSSSVRILTGCVIGITLLAILWEVLVIVLRFCNVGLINIAIKIFLVLEIIVEILTVLSHLAGCAGSIVLTTRTGPGSIIVIAVFCFLAALLYGFLAVWDIVFIMRGWTKKIIKYTIKEAIIG